MVRRKRQVNRDEIGVLRGNKEAKSKSTPIDQLSWTGDFQVFLKNLIDSCVTLNFLRSYSDRHKDS